MRGGVRRVFGGRGRRDGARAGALSGVVAHFHCGVADAACARCESAPSSRLATHAAAALGFARRTPPHWNTGRRSLLPSSRRPRRTTSSGSGTATPPPRRSPSRTRARRGAAAARRPRRAAGPAGEADAAEVTAAYPYQGQRASDLSFAAGDVVVVTRKKANDGGSATSAAATRPRPASSRRTAAR